MTKPNPGRWQLDQQLLANLAGIRELSLHRATNLRDHAKPTSQSELLWVSLALQEQALANVVGNALKFTPDDGAVQLTARVLDDAMEVRVRDTGPGLAPEHLRSIFEPFTRVDARGTSPGLGLGLNITRRIVELHGGSIAAESDGAGCGTTFRVQLPLAGPRC